MMIVVDLTVLDSQVESHVEGCVAARLDDQRLAYVRRFIDQVPVLNDGGIVVSTMFETTPMIPTRRSATSVTMCAG